jgi:hypothetical protein
MQDYQFISKLNFVYHPVQRQRFQSGEIVQAWVARYPNLFDENDLRIQNTQPTYHFYEWLAAVLLYEAMGYYTLMEKYETASHPEKLERFKKIVPPAVAKDVFENRTGVPDLFVHSPDGTDWFFCEVKGANDRLRKHQIERFKQLAEVGGRKVCVLSLKEKML